MFKLHLGKPEFETVIRFCYGRSHATICGERRSTDHIVHHPIKRIYGISFGAKLLFGLMLFERSDIIREKSNV